jgi:hypothetical protein
MEEWELDFKWLEVRHKVREQLGRKEPPDLNGLLFLIGIQELGRWKERFTKEEKQDLMHIATCHLLSYDGYYAFKGRDADGWPHYEMIRPFRVKGVKDQSVILKENIIRYFTELESESTQTEEE